MNLSRFLLAFALLVAPVAVQAARVTPMVVDLDETGRGTVGRIEITNTGENGMPIEVLMFRGIISEAGELELVPADEQFLVFPPQTIVPPRSQQIIRVQYIGEEPLQTSEIFYASIREVPVKGSRAGVNVQIVATFNVLVNVVPSGSASAAALEVIGPAERDGKPGIEVKVTNSGNKFFAAGRVDWSVAGKTVDGAAYERTYRAREMGSVIGYGIVPARGARRFFVPTPQPILADSINIKMNN
ncbi:MAG: molecular chaperone [Sphingopyxis sp.]|nr:molecular chaperone [Sphingopyxis sp.]